MEIRPIKTETDYDEALAEVETLMDAAPGSSEEAKLEVLATLIESYESKVHPIDAPDPISALQYYMESRGITRKDLEASIGSRARVSEVLNRRRPLTLVMIQNLVANHGISAEVLVGKYNRNPTPDQHLTARAS
jgi:HTH-type transcriptional regulator/antitoxin HigA